VLKDDGHQAGPREGARQPGPLKAAPGPPAGPSSAQAPGHTSLNAAEAPAQPMSKHQPIQWLESQPKELQQPAVREPRGSLGGHDDKERHVGDFRRQQQGPQQLERVRQQHYDDRSHQPSAPEQRHRPAAGSPPGEARGPRQSETAAGRDQKQPRHKPLFHSALVDVFVDNPAAHRRSK
jgi:hypothetical protein